MKKTLGLGLIILLMVLGTAWAGGKQEAAAKVGPVEIIYYLWDDPTYNQIVDTFNESQNEVYVKTMVIPAGDYETKLTTLLAGGAEMDAYMQKRQADMFPQYANGYIHPLDDLVAKHGYDLEAVLAYESAIRIDGKLLAIPFRGATYYTYYNRKLFQQAGLPDPDHYVDLNEWTWDRFAQVANKLASGDGSVYGGLFYIWGLCHVIPALQNEIDFITPDGEIELDDSVRYSFALRRDLEESKAIWSLIDLKVTKTHYSKAFYDGNVGMLIIGEWFPGQMLKGRDDELLVGYTWNDWAITRLPCNLPDYRSVGNPTFNHIHVNSKKKDSAFKFISWMGGPLGARVVAEAGFLPPIVTPQVISALEKAIPDERSLKMFAEGPRVIPTFYSKYGSRVEMMIQSIIEEYLVEKWTDEELMQRMRVELNDIIQTTD